MAAAEANSMPQQRARDWLRREICDNEADLKSDAVEDLRIQIFALPARPFLNDACPFVRTLDVDGIPIFEIRRMLRRFASEDVLNVLTRAVELSLLLRLLVAQGVDLNLLDDVVTTDVTTKRRIHALETARTHSSMVPILFQVPNFHSSAMGFALLAAGRRLGLDYAKRSVSGIISSCISASAMLSRIFSCGVMSTQEHMTRVGHVARERGMLFCGLGMSPFARGERFQMAMAQFLDDDASPHRWPAEDVENNPNARRDAYRKAAPLLVLERLPIPDICNIVLGYFWLPM